MDAIPIHARQDKLLRAVPAGRNVVFQRRFGKDRLADEVFNDRSSLAARYAEAALMCAVLEDAIDCFQKQFSRATRHAKHLAREAEVWFFSDDLNWPFSFACICSVLDLSPQYIRQGLKRWHADKKSADGMCARPPNGLYKSKLESRKHSADEGSCSFGVSMSRLTAAKNT